MTAVKKPHPVHRIGDAIGRGIVGTLKLAVQIPLGIVMCAKFGD